MRLAVALALLASPAAAGDTYTWGPADCRLSCVRLLPVMEGEAVAEVVFKNDFAHNTGIEFHTLTIPGLSVTLEMRVGNGDVPDEMFVTPPEGFIAVPPAVVVPEKETGRVLIVPLKDMVLG